MKFRDKVFIWLLLALGLGVIVFDFMTCNIHIEELSDGWYIVMEEGEYDSWGNYHGHEKPLDGPYSESEINSLVEECENNALIKTKFRLP